MKTLNFNQIIFLTIKSWRRTAINTMKNLVKTIALCLFASISFAQTSSTIIEQEIRVKDGQNSAILKNGAGTLTFLVRNNEVANAIIREATGKILRFETSDESETGVPAPECKQCARYVYNKETMSVIIFCMPCSISVGDGGVVAFTRYMKRAKRSE